VSTRFRPSSPRTAPRSRATSSQRSRVRGGDVGWKPGSVFPRRRAAENSSAGFLAHLWAPLVFRPAVEMWRTLAVRATPEPSSSFARKYVLHAGQQVRRCKRLRQHDGDVWIVIASSRRIGRQRHDERTVRWEGRTKRGIRNLSRARDNGFRSLTRPTDLPLLLLTPAASAAGAAHRRR
jgi:hypothetical protein